METSEYYSDVALRERCLLMAIDVHKAAILEGERSLRNDAKVFFDFIKDGNTNDKS